MESIIQKFSVKILRHKLEEFYPQYLSQINWDSVDLMNTLDGLIFIILFFLLHSYEYFLIFFF